MQKNDKNFIRYLFTLSLLFSYAFYGMEIDQEELSGNEHLVSLDPYQQIIELFLPPACPIDSMSSLSPRPSSPIGAFVSHLEMLPVELSNPEPVNISLVCPWCQKVVGERASTMPNVIVSFRRHARNEHGDKTRDEYNAVIKRKFPHYKIRARNLSETGTDKDEAVTSTNTEEAQHKRKKTIVSQDLSVRCPCCEQILGQNILIRANLVGAVRRHISRQHPGMTQKARNLFIKEKFPQHRLRPRREYTHGITKADAQGVHKLSGHLLQRTLTWKFPIICPKCPSPFNIFGSDLNSSHAVYALKSHWKNKHKMVNMDEFFAYVKHQFPDYRFNNRHRERKEQLICYCGKKYSSGIGVSAVVAHLRNHFRKKHPDDVENFSEIVKARYPNYQLVEALH